MKRREGMQSVRNWVCTVFVLSAVLFLPAAAGAEETSAAHRGSEAPEESAPSDAAPRAFGLTLGAAAGYAPVAKGVDAWQPVAMPHVEARLGRRVVLGTSGLAVRVLGVTAPGGPGSSRNRVRAAVRVLPNLGRYDEHLPQDYKGLGDVPFTAEAAVDVGVRLWKGLEATGMVAGDALGRGHGGFYAAAGARLRGALGQTGLHYGVGADIVAATRDYMESYYGVSSKQAAETGLEAYDARAGVEAARARLTLGLPLGPHLTVATEVTVRSLLGSARRSPVARATEQGATQLVVMYNL